MQPLPQRSKIPAGICGKPFTGRVAPAVGAEGFGNGGEIPLLLPAGHGAVTQGGLSQAPEPAGCLSDPWRGSPGEGLLLFAGE